MRYVKQALIKRINEEFDFNIPLDVHIIHLSPSWNQKSAGAWAWFFYFEDRQYGSPIKMTNLLKQDKLELYYPQHSLDVEIF